MDRHFDTRRRLVYLTARLIGPAQVVRLTLALDTGAERTTIRPASLRLAGYEPDRSASFRHMRSAVGSARVLLVGSVSLSCAGVERSGLVVAAHEFSARF